MLKLLCVVCLVAAGATAEDRGKGPLPYTRRSIAQGKQLFLANCVDCHDEDGRGLNRRDFNSTIPADLTELDEYRHGISPEALFSSIRTGTKEDMPAFKGRLNDEQIWNIVNFVRGFWPDEKRPKLEEEH